MEEQVTYSTVSFKNGGSAPKKEEEIATIYSSVKPKAAPAAAPSADSACSVLAVCLGIACVFLLISVSLNIYLGWLKNQKQTNIYELTAQNELLLGIKSGLERRMKQLNEAKDELNQTLEAILTFDNFPVKEFCPDKKCQPCKTSWLPFQGKCYFFSNKYPWDTWQNSRTLCKNEAADLIVIDNLDEQEFMSNNTKFYYDEFHGFWMGLEEHTNQQWVWIDGQNDTLQFWINKDFGTPGPCGLMIPGRNLTASWDPAECDMRNKFICERDALWVDKVQ